MALDASTRRKIDSVVKDWIAEGKMFTAFEISLAAKKLGVEERHRNMKHYVHEAIAREANDRSWTRTLMDVGAPVQAWLYHRIRDNPFTYVPLDRGSGSVSQEAQAARDARKLRNPKPLTADAPEPKSADDGAYGVDAEGQLKIPVGLASQLRVAAGDKVHIRRDQRNAAVVITRASQFLGGEFDEEIQVADDGSILLSEETLAAAEIDGLQSYLIDAKGNQITVSEFT